MNRISFHLCGGAILILVSLVTWLLQSDSSVSPLSSEQTLSHPNSNQRTSSHPKAPPRDVAQKEPKPLIETELIRVTRGSFFLQAPTLENKEEALASVLALPPSTRRDETISNILKSIAKQDPNLAKKHWLAWKHARTDPWLDAASAICLALAAKDPFSPSDFINQHIPRSAHFDVWNSILQRMDFQPASEVFESLPRTNQSLAATKGLTLYWIKDDPTSCLAWLDSWLPTLNEKQRTKFLQTHSYWARPQSGAEGFKSHLAAYRQATHPQTREYLARIVLETRNAPNELMESFKKEIETNKE